MKHRKRKKRIMLGLEAADLKDAKANAKALGLSLNEYIRRRVNGRPLKAVKLRYKSQDDSLAGTESQPEHSIAAFEKAMGRKPSSHDEYMEWWGEQEVEVFVATQEVDFGEGWKTIEAETFDEESARNALECRVAQYRRQQAERQVIQAGGVELWYSSLSPALALEWADLKQSLLAWERQAKQDREYWQQVKRAEQPAAKLESSESSQAVTEAQKIADAQKAIDSDRQRTARLTGIML